MEQAGRSCGRWFPEFLFVPCSDRRYRVVVDGAGWADGDSARRGERLGALAAELERQLRRAATGYDFEREDALLEPLQLVVTAPGQLREYLASRWPRGGGRLPNAQVKPMHLSVEFDAHGNFTAVASHAA